MGINILLSGLVLGFSIAAPVGPIGILCIRRTLAEGRASGLFAGLGAATADGFFGGVAAFGLSFVADAAAHALGEPALRRDDHTFWPRRTVERARLMGGTLP